MKNFVQRGNTLTLTAPAAVVSGQPIIVGSVFGIVNGDAASGDPMDVDVVGVFNLPKVAADAFAEGAAVYWDNTAKLVTSTTTGNTKIGVAVTAAANPSATVHVRLNGSF
jgi:predicted RecA/RadA family phage recombinase